MENKKENDKDKYDEICLDNILEGKTVHNVEQVETNKKKEELYPNFNDVVTFTEHKDNINEVKTKYDDNQILTYPQFMDSKVETVPKNDKTNMEEEKNNKKVEIESNDNKKISNIIKEDYFNNNKEDVEKKIVDNNNEPIIEKKETNIVDINTVQKDKEEVKEEKKEIENKEIKKAPELQNKSDLENEPKHKDQIIEEKKEDAVNLIESKDNKDNKEIQKQTVIDNKQPLIDDQPKTDNKSPLINQDKDIEQKKNSKVTEPPILTIQAKNIKEEPLIEEDKQKMNTKEENHPDNLIEPEDVKSNEIIKEKDNTFEQVVQYPNEQESNHNDFLCLDKEDYVKPSFEEYIQKSNQNIKEEQSSLDIASLYNEILIANGKPISKESYYWINEKEEIVDFLGSHKVYEILYMRSNGDKEIKCSRRYDNFYQFHQKLKKKYPYIIIPNLTPKKNLLVSVSFEKRRLQLIFYLNFIGRHSQLKETKEFLKFINDPNFDSHFFQLTSLDNPLPSFNSSTSEMLKNKFYSVLNFMGGVKSRAMNNDEINLKNMAIHYNNILTKYKDIKNSICEYLNTINIEGDEYRKFSEILVYLKDSFINVEHSTDSLMKYSQYSSMVSKSNLNNITKLDQLDNKLEAMIYLLGGICDSLDSYCSFIKRFENVEQMKKAAKEGNWDNINLIINEYDVCVNYKNLCEQSLTQEVQYFIGLFEKSTKNILEEFHNILIKVNNEIVKSNRETSVNLIPNN